MSWKRVWGRLEGKDAIPIDSLLQSRRWHGLFDHVHIGIQKRLEAELKGIKLMKAAEGLLVEYCQGRER